MFKIISLENWCREVCTLFYIQEGPPQLHFAEQDDDGDEDTTDPTTIPTTTETPDLFPGFCKAGLCPPFTKIPDEPTVLTR